MKSIYDEALEIMINSILPREGNKTNKLKVIKALKQVQEQEKLLELYDKLAEHRLMVINELLNEIMDLTHLDDIEQFIDYIKYEAKHYGDEDAKIIEEIAKIKET